MCGIAGLYSNKPVTDPGLLLEMRDTLVHRGPDDAGVWWSPDKRVGLAHRRLSIIDLTEAGHQPMSDPSGSVRIVYNGEIYNFQDLREELADNGCSFVSHSDTEVLLQAYRRWGTDCLQHLNGAFAFALYDSAEELLFLARDRAGEKPLFYSWERGEFRFASEMKALMADPALPRRVSLEALDLYLAYGYVPGERCILEHVHKLAPAQAMKLSLRSGELQVWQYWHLPGPEGAGTVSEDELTGQLQQLLQDAVQRQMVADVPVGVLLSGGLDSSLVTALATASSARQVKTFTVTFPGHGAYDEGPYARLTAKHFGTDHTELVAQPATVDLLPELARQFDEPVADSSIVPTYLVSKLIREHCTVALGGDGGDELFGGYPTYNWIFRHERIRRLAPAAVRNLLSAGAKYFLPTGFKGRNFIVGCGGSLPNCMANFNLRFDEALRLQLLPALAARYRGTFPGLSPERYKAGMWQNIHGLPGEAMALDFKTYLPDDILVKVDRSSMMNSLEVRAPFLDYRVIDFAFRRVPNSLRADRSRRKILLRKLGERLLPPLLDTKRKQGFVMPLGSWFKGEWGSGLRGILLDSAGSFFDRKTVERLWQGQENGLNNTERLFSIAMLELWRQQYKIELP